MAACLNRVARQERTADRPRLPRTIIASPRRHDAVSWACSDSRRRSSAIACLKLESDCGSAMKYDPLIHVVVENQIALGDEIPVRRAVQRLMSEGLDRHDSIHAVGSVLIGHIGELLGPPETEPGVDPTPPTTSLSTA